MADECAKLKKLMADNGWSFEDVFQKLSASNTVVVNQSNDVKFNNTAQLNDENFSGCVTDTSADHLQHYQENLGGCITDTADGAPHNQNNLSVCVTDTSADELQPNHKNLGGCVKVASANELLGYENENITEEHSSETEDILISHKYETLNGSIISTTNAASDQLVHNNDVPSHLDIDDSDIGVVSDEILNTAEDSDELHINNSSEFDSPTAKQQDNETLKPAGHYTCTSVESVVNNTVLSFCNNTNIHNLSSNEVNGVLELEVRCITDVYTECDPMEPELSGLHQDKTNNGTSTVFSIGNNSTLEHSKDRYNFNCAIEEQDVVVNNTVLLKSAHVNERKRKYDMISSEESQKSVNCDSPDTSNFNYEESTVEIDDDNCNIKMKEQSCMLQSPRTPICQIKSINNIVEPNCDTSNGTICTTANMGNRQLDMADLHMQKTPDNLHNELEMESCSELNTPQSNESIKKLINAFKVRRLSRHSGEKTLLKRFQTENQSKNTKLCNNIDDSLLQINVPHIDESEPTTKIDDSSTSVFTSDKLDHFLANDADLKITYKVPNIDVTIMEVSNNLRPQRFLKVSSRKLKREGTTSKKKSDYRPKTLAEKRRVYNSSMKKSIPRCKRIHNERMRVRSGKRSFSRRYCKTAISSNDVQNYIIYKGKRLKVVSKSRPQIVAKINGKIPTKSGNTNLKQKKLLCKKELLNTETEGQPSRSTKKSLVVDSKKSTNNKHSRNTNGKRIIQRLPKVYLQVVPEIRKPINPKFEHILNFDYMISEDRANFALTVLKVDGNVPEPKIFTFPVNYKNNQSTVSLKKCLDPTKIEVINPDLVENDMKITNPVCGMHTMLGHAEISHYTDNLLKVEDGVAPDIQHVSDHEMVYVNESGSKRSRHTKKLSKVSLEMKRLNCSFISIAFDEEDKQESCDLANHGPLLTTCKGGYDENRNKRTITLPAQTNIYSSSLLSHIDNEAKKDLAKVEKQFSQTFIQTNNGIMMLGESNKRRRETKLPKRYYDYVDQDLPEYKPDIKILKDATTVSVNNDSELCTQFGIKPSSVVVQKLDVSSLVPFCLIHSIYKCPCSNQDIVCIGTQDIKNINSFIANDMGDARTRGLPSKFYTLRNSTDAYKKLLAKDIQKFKLELVQDLFRNTDQVTRENHSQSSHVELLDCPPKMCKKPVMNCKQLTKYPKRKSIATDEMYDAEVILLLEDTVEMDEDFVNLIIANQNYKKKPYRKMTWQVFAKKFEAQKIQVWYCDTLPQLTITYNCIRPSRAHLNIRCMKNSRFASSETRRITKCLLEDKVPSNISPTEFYIIVIQTRLMLQICGVFERSLPKIEEASETLGDTKTEDSLESGIDAQLTSDEIIIPSAEIITPTAEVIKPSAEIITPTAEIIKPTDEIIIPTADENVLAEDAILQSIKDNKQVMLCSKCQFQPIKLTCTSSSDKNEIGQVLWASIPTVTSASKWRVIYLNDQFDYLCFSQSNYIITHIDIVKALKMAQTQRTTIVLRSSEIHTYPHSDFGLYCVCNYGDKIFVGPYFADDEDDLESCSMLNGVLVYTDMFKNNLAWYHQAASLVETDDDEVILIHTSPAIIDLTYESDEELTIEHQKQQETSILQQTPNSNGASLNEMEILTTNDQNTEKDNGIITTPLTSKNVMAITEPQEQIKQSSEKLPSASKKVRDNVVQKHVSYENILVGDSIPECNNYVLSNIGIAKYIISDVPNIGYIIAYERPNSSIVDIICPISHRTISFGSASIALQSVARFLENHMILVPHLFKLKLRLINRFENVGNSPLDKNILDGCHILGKFGVKNLRKVSLKDLKELGLNGYEIIRILNKHEGILLRFQIKALAKTLQIPVNEHNNLLQIVIEKGGAEIGQLQIEAENLNREYQLYKEDNSKLIQKCNTLYSELPQKDKTAFKQICGTSTEFKTNIPTRNRRTNNSDKCQRRVNTVVLNPLKVAQNTDSSSPHRSPIGSQINEIKKSTVTDIVNTKPVQHTKRLLSNTFAFNDATFDNLNKKVASQKAAKVVLPKSVLGNIMNPSPQQQTKTNPTTTSSPSVLSSTRVLLKATTSENSVLSNKSTYSSTTNASTSSTFKILSRTTVSNGIQRTKNYSIPIKNMNAVKIGTLTAISPSQLLSGTTCPVTLQSTDSASSKNVLNFVTTTALPLSRAQIDSISQSSTMNGKQLILGTDSSGKKHMTPNITMKSVLKRKLDTGSLNQTPRKVTVVPQQIYEVE